MKKPYQKPEVCVENFVLANNIASNCTGDIVPTLSNGYTCKANDSFGTFHSEYICEWTVSEEEYNDSEYEGICYNTPSGNVVIFSN
ncbi:MAG: hypothetical protein Q4C58_12965 [Eubacteriales bacterium]|nr:hypothetical protein [Eubacteriales bacterium]